MIQREMTRLQDWVGRSEIVEDEAGLVTVRRIAALLDRDPAKYRRGDPLPENWHSVFFGTATLQSELGADGHPRKGEFLPPIPLPRRLFAGRRLRFIAPVPIGADMRLVSTIGAITPKAGRSGEMVFVRVDRIVEVDGRATIREEHDIVYRPDATPGAVSEAAVEEPPLPAAQASEVFAPDTTALFRYSALCFNAHRIHYDLPYAREREGYAGLVVNGGLTALRLCELAKRHLPTGQVSRFLVRNVRPMIAGQRGELRIRREAEGRVSLWAVDGSGRTVARAEAAGPENPG